MIAKSEETFYESSSESAKGFACQSCNVSVTDAGGTNGFHNWLPGSGNVRNAAQTSFSFCRV